MAKALRALIVGMMLMSILAACGGTNAGTSASPAGASPAGAVSTAPSTAASEAASSAASTAPSTAASEAASSAASTAPSTAASEAASSAASTAASTAAGTSASPAGSAAATVELPEINPADAPGAIITAGSSTVFPLSQAIAEVWVDEGGTAPTIDSIGTGGGFERFCEAGETDIANASRAINDEEIQACGALNPPRTPIEFRVGTDALAIVVSSENDFLEEITLDQLKQIFSTASTWNEIDPSYPNEPIQRFVPGTDSGTFDYFVEEVFGDEENAAEPLLNAANLQQSEDDNVLVQGIEGSPNAIGFFGYAYYQENQERLKILTVDGVEPSEQTTENGEYPLARPLFIYSDATIMREKPQVAAFVNFYLSRVNDVITEVGYFPASEATLNQAKQAFLDAAE